MYWSVGFMQQGFDIREDCRDDFCEVMPEAGNSQQTVPVPAGSQMHPLLAKAESITKWQQLCDSIIKKVKNPTVQQQLEERSENM